MLSIYGILYKACKDCNFQFFTDTAYFMHKEENHCDMYAQIEMPALEKQLEIVNDYRKTLEFL